MFSMKTETHNGTKRPTASKAEGGKNMDQKCDIVNTCTLTKFEGGLNLVHEANDDAVVWLESTATAALA